MALKATASSLWGDDFAAPAPVREALPPPSEEGPDADGIKTVTSYRRNEKGQVEKVVRRYKVITTVIRTPKAAEERKKTMVKFGAAKGGNQGITYPSNDDIGIDRPQTAANQQAKGPEVDAPVPAGPLASCRRCGGPHWSMACPFKDQIALPGQQAPGGGAGGEARAPGSAYVPPSLRNLTPGAPGEVRPLAFEEQVQLRVSNLSPETTEDDLRGLFQPFGRLDKIFVAKDKVTFESRGFAFIKYTRHSDANAAKENLHNYRLHHMVLRVEWSEPREPGQGGPGGAGGGKFGALAGSGARFLSGYGKALAQDSAAGRTAARL